MIIELDNIELNFNSRNILHGVYLKAETGRITGILGANGSGKSSLLNILFGCLRPQHKLLKIDSKPVLKPLFSLGIAKLLPQQPLIPTEMKVQQAFRLYHASWIEFLTMFPNFEKYSKAGIHELSGGERRVLETYLSISSPSSIVLLDEPFSHLAPVYVEKMKQLIIETASKKAVIITDHLYREILDLADNLYLLTNGCSTLIEDYKKLESYHYLNPDTL